MRPAGPGPPERAGVRTVATRREARVRRVARRRLPARRNGPPRRLPSGRERRHGPDDDVREAQSAEDRQLFGDAVGIAVGHRSAIEPPVATGDERVADLLGLDPVFSDEHVLSDRDPDRSCDPAGHTPLGRSRCPAAAVSGVRSALPYQQSPSRAARSIAFRHTPADPPFHSLGREWSDAGPVDVPQVAVDGHRPAAGPGRPELPLRSGPPLCCSSAPMARNWSAPPPSPAWTMNGPDDMAASVPICSAISTGCHNGDEKQAAHGTVGPFRQKATEHRHVLHVSSRTGGVVVAQGQAVEAGPVGGLGLAQHLERPLPLAARAGGAERGANGYADAHHPKVSLTSPQQSRRGE